MSQKETCTAYISEEKSNSYRTIWGDLSFEEIYQKTYRLAAFTLRKYGVSNSQDIEDALQAAYFKIWQRLQKDPQWFANKPLNYIIRSIYYSSKVQRLSHYRYNRKTVYDAVPEEQVQKQFKFSQLDQWIDLQSAIISVAEAARDNHYALFALYSLVTQVTSVEVRRNIRCSNKTMVKYRNQIRDQLKHELRAEESMQESASKLVSISVAKLLLDSVSI